jgi:hypothetical protein
LENSTLYNDFVDYVRNECCPGDVLSHSRCSWLVKWLKSPDTCQDMDLVAYLKGHLRKVAECAIGAVIVEVWWYLAGAGANYAPHARSPSVPFHDPTTPPPMYNAAPQ